ncbi:adenosine deaminase, tRNA-specific 3, TAD3 homolog [Nasonia vitripennis]|uniref:CMP/dCMP-type deaminase domain-containing protein n=1 Tax=Nasonia vitripennis TaxID=7425 RepID=A0A7M6W8A9_NASVI|nr:adenosine deaminase, tRNA-specific 3, TAD3 homolog [Nasonia vitripennis]
MATDQKKSKMEDSLAKKNPRPILAEELIRLPELQKSFIGVLKEKKAISKAIAGLGPILPSPQHLKRCSGLRIYLAPVDKMNESAEGLKKLLSDKGFDLTLFEDELEILEVVATPPRTKSQMEYASKFWPVNFHPDLNLEALISESLFSDEQLASLEFCMRLAIAAAKDSAIGSSECNGSAVIVNPDDATILSIAASSQDKHPMWHASMLAVDLVAKVQGGGAWKLIQDSNSETDTLKRKLGDSLPLRYPESIFKIEVPKENGLSFIAKDQKKKQESRKEFDDKCAPYLCTGYWAFLLQEPCSLCAMALLHSRVSRIFYGATNPKTGILGSRATLHSVPGLNHRYQVWSELLRDECEETLKACRTIDD